MASNSVEDERKRKRAQDTQDSHQQRTKKVKSEDSHKRKHKHKRSGELSATAAVSGGTSPLAQLGKSRDASSTKVGIQQGGENPVRLQEKQQPKASGADTEIQNVQVTEDDQDLESKGEDDDARKLRKLERKRLKLIKKSKLLEDGSHEIILTDDRLPHLLKQAKKLVDKHALGQDDELVKMQNRHSNIRQDLWEVSRPMGGRYIDHDPLYSEDERYIILATPEHIHVYEAETSLLVRTMHAHGISCFARSTPHPHHLYVGTVYGKLYRFEWTTGERQGIVEASRGGCIRGLTTVQLPNTDEEAVFTTEMAPRSSKRQREVEKNADENFIHTLVFRKAPWDESEDARQVLHKSDRSLRHLKVLDGGRMIFVASENQLLIGTLPGTVGVSTTSFKKLTSEYRWRHLDSNHAISCFDVYPQLVSPQGKPGKSRQREQYDLALGNAKGELLIFENVVQQLEMIENQGSNKPARARMLRWHREAPNTVKWSKDANYLLSGGKETVLCLWQLETGRRQELPHLTAAVQSVTVSPSGTTYAIQLSDNSAIVLSTAELQPKMHIAGLQSLCIWTPQTTTKDGLLASARDVYTATPLVNNPRRSKDLCLAVPVDQQFANTMKSSPAAPFLQTYDLQAARHVSRQALTRNFVTETNIDPDWNKIETPNVTQMQISHDGSWLAIVEEWMPPAHALQHLAFDNDELVVERRKRRETYLKIWYWNEESKTWGLNTRVDSPHADESNEQANRTFHLIAHPKKAGFATIGEDSSVRIWQPRKRGDDTAWITKSVFRLERSAAVADEAMDFPLPAAPVIGQIAYSNDGSVLAVSLQDDSSLKGSVIQLLDAETGKVRSAETGLAVGHLLAMGFLDRYLILVSGELRVWDVVIGTMVCARTLGKAGLSLSQRLATTHLAISAESASFAVAGIDIISGRAGSTILVFKPTNIEPILSFHLKIGAVSALTPLVDGSGYVALDSLAEIRKICTYHVPIMDGAPTAILGAMKDTQTMEIDNDGGEEEQEDATAGAAKLRPPAVPSIEDDRQLLKSEQLARVFASGAGGFGLPSVKEMFESVAGLFAVKAN